MVMTTYAPVIWKLALRNCQMQSSMSYMWYDGIMKNVVIDIHNVQIIIVKYFILGGPNTDILLKQMIYWHWKTKFSTKLVYIDWRGALSSRRLYKKPLIPAFRYRPMHPQRVTVGSEFLCSCIISPFSFEDDTGKIATEEWKIWTRVIFGLSRTVQRDTQPIKQSIFCALSSIIVLSAFLLMSIIV